VFNRGYGGYNTRWAKHLMRDLFPETEGGHTLVLVFFGANDAADATLQPRQHVPLAEYTANLLEMVTYLRTKAAQVRERERESEWGLAAAAQPRVCGRYHSQTKPTHEPPPIGPANHITV
jgi:hypothetical protein